MQAEPKSQRAGTRFPADARVWTLNAVLVIAAAAMYRPAVSGTPFRFAHQFGINWWILALLFIAVELVTIKLVFRHEGYNISFSEIPLILGLFFASPVALLAARGVGTVIAFGVYRRQPPIKLVFNVAHMVVETCVALMVCRALASGAGGFTFSVVVVVLAATAATVAVAAGSITAAIALYEGALRTGTLMSSFATHGLAAVTNATLALTLVVVVTANPAAGWLLLAPAGVLLVAYHTLTVSREKQDGLEFLYESSRLLHRGETLVEPIVALLELARETFHADNAELILHSDTERGRGLRTAVGPGHSVHRLEPVDLTSLDLPALRPGSAMASTLDGEKRRLGTLLVSGPSQAQGRFTSRQLQLFATFANTITMALENGLLEASLTEVTALKDEMRHQAFHDELTGLGNRALFSAELSSTLEGRPATASVGVVFIDIDDFKSVNDLLGHPAGDTLLVHVADCLRSSVRPGDIASRLGGDEFAILLKWLDSDEDAAAVADRLLDTLAEPVFLQGQRVVVGASVGIATASGPTGKSADHLLRDADLAMYAAKARGKNRAAMFEPSMQQELLARHAAKTELERAIERGEFVVHFQPIVDLRTHEPIGCEALVRWAHPERGLLLPGAFVPTAEELGLIDHIGRFVVTTATMQLAEWQRRSRRRTALAVSVNVSALEFNAGDFEERIIGIVREAGVAPGSVIIEITETAMIHSSERTTEKLRTLRKAGLRLAVDDFGTGYSSLRYLEDLAIDILKVPKNFIDGLAHDRNRPALAQAIVQLGKTLSLDVVAEGVETWDQVAALQHLGCGLAQGFVFSRPIDAEAMSQMFADSDSRLNTVDAV